MSVRKRLSGSTTQTDGQARNFAKAVADRRVSVV